MFENFSKINYYLNGQTLELTDIFKSINVDTTNTASVNSKKNTDKLRPDQFADKLYNDPKLFWVNFALNGIKNPFREWNQSGVAVVQQNSNDYDTKVFQFGNTGKYLPTNNTYFNSNDIDSYLGVSLTNIEQNDIIIFETGAGVFELKTYGAGSITGLNSCGYPHFGQTDIPDNFLNRNNIVQISCGKNFTACLDDQGYIWAWGQDIGLQTSSGFVLNGRLYNSPRGGYKHIDTTNNKIIAVNYNDGLECFGTCGDFTYTGETQVVKSSWMSGTTLAGLVIKKDNTVKILGPIVSTNSTLQYFSDVSCADNYCLGVVTGPVSNGNVIGFGSTGYFSQIGQNSFYSSELTNLGVISPSNPIYPFSDEQNKIVKTYDTDVLEVVFTDLQPFTSPNKNKDQGYRSYYTKIYASDDENKSLIGFTDFDTHSKEGYLINNPKTFAGAGYEPYESKTYDYTQFYDKNLKPNEHYNLYRNSEKKYFGTTFVNGVNFYRSFAPIDGVKYINLPQFKIRHSQQYKNLMGGDQSFFTSLINYSSLNGYTFIDKYGTDPYLDGVGQVPYTTGITSICHISEGQYDVLVMNNNKIKIEGRNVLLSDTNEYASIINIASNKDNPQGVSLNYRGDYFDKFGSVDYVGNNSGHGLWLLKDNGTPYVLREPLNTYDTYNAGGSDFYKNWWKDMLPPSGLTFSKVDFGAANSCWVAGLKGNGEIILWGITADIEINFGITYAPYTIPGVTGKDIAYNGDNLIVIRNNGTIFQFGGQNTSSYSFDEFYGGITVTNALKIIGPTLKYAYDLGFVLTTDNKLIVLQPNTTVLGQAASNVWKQDFGYTLGGWPITDNTKSFVDNLFDYYLENGKEKLNVSYLVEPNYNQIKDIYGSSNYCFVTKTNNEKVFIQGFPYRGTQSPLPWYAHGTEILTKFYGLDVTKYKTLKQDTYFGSARFLNYETQHKISFTGYELFDSIYEINIIGQQFRQDSDQYKEITPTTFTDGIQLNFNISDYNSNTNNGIVKGIPFVQWHPSIWNTNGNYFSQPELYNLVYGGATLSDYGTSKYGCYILNTDKNNTQKLFIVSRYGMDYGYCSTPIKYINKIVLGNGFLIELHPDDTLSFIIGDKQPYNKVSDFSNFNVINTIDITDPEQFNTWENFISQKLAIGSNRFYGYRPDYINKNVNYWGSNINNSLAPKGLTYSQIDCFYGHCCGLNTDGIVECWGDNNTGISSFFTPPPSLGVCKQVVVGFDHTCAEDITGKITCWGQNDYGQTTVPSSVNDGTSNKILDCGKYFSSVLKADGRLLIWGRAITGPAQIINFGSSIPTELEIES